MDSLAYILSVVEQAKTFGYKELSNGTRLYGKVPHVAPEAWLHYVFPPLSDDRIDKIESLIERPLPEVIREIYSRANGLKLFSSSLTLYGLRDNYIRTIDSCQQQPFDISTSNTWERPRDAAPELIFLGSYKWDGSYLYIDPDSDHVYRCHSTSARPLNEWPGIWEMLVAEANRLKKLYDDRGRKFDEDVPTIPLDEF